MEQILYEIVMLPNGDVVLQRANDQDAPLVKITFSDEAKGILGDHRLIVAKEMIDAGIDVAQDLNHPASTSYDDGRDAEHTLH